MAHRSSLLLISAVTLAGYATLAGVVMLLGVLVGSALAYSQGYPDPFAAYEAITREQPIDDRRCDAQLHDPVTHQTVCTITPKDGPFSEVDVLGCACDPATLELAFWSERLQVGELELRWGRPDTMTPTDSGQSYLLLWKAAQVEAYTLPATQVTVKTLVQLVRWHR